jgi:hypothetical protein
VQVTGDGAIGFHIQEWDTMVRHGLPIVTVVFNNSCGRPRPPPSSGRRRRRGSTTRVISLRSRPRRSQCSASASSLRGTSDGAGQVRLVGVLGDHAQGLALARPPIITGIRDIGAGELIASVTW